MIMRDVPRELWFPKILENMFTKVFTIIVSVLTTTRCLTSSYYYSENINNMVGLE